MASVWLHSALWLGLALLASLISIRVAISVALIEIVVGAVAGNLVALQITDCVNFLAGFGAIIGFAATLLVAMGTAFTIIALYYWRLPPVAPVIATFAVNVVWYIPAVWFMDKRQHHVVGPLRGEF